MRNRSQRPFVMLIAVVLVVTIQFARAQGIAERAPSPPATATSQDAIAQLIQELASTRLTLNGTDQEILRTVLRALHVPVESQTLVFSKTSLEARLIHPANPRALFFSDDIYVGWVPGGLVEAAVMVPGRGPVFYSMDPADAREGRRSFVRERSCLRCHSGSKTGDGPELLALSVLTGAGGERLSQPGADSVGDATPFGIRWGGWYVTGYAGSEAHRGNAFGLKRGDAIEFHPTDKRPTDLSGYFDTARYLMPTSDVVALCVLAHQVAMHNCLTRAARTFQHLTVDLNDEGTKAALAKAVEDVLDHLLFREAAPLPAGVAGSDAFNRAFAAGAKRDGQGNSLRDLSLHGQLFANRCSFLIYSDGFTTLPAPLKSRVLDCLFSALRDEGAPRYAYLPQAERRRIFEILCDTLPDAQRFAIQGRH